MMQSDIQEMVDLLTEVAKAGRELSAPSAAFQQNAAHRIHTKIGALSPSDDVSKLRHLTDPQPI